MERTRGMREWNLSIIIPAYNEEATIGEVLRQVALVNTQTIHVQKQIIVVDDGSTDSTAAVVRAFGRAHLISHPLRRGKGEAIRTALAHATGDLVLIQDADLEYDPSDYLGLLAPILDGSARTVFGSRFLAQPHPHGMVKSHLWANRLLTHTTNSLFRCVLTDMTTCYKLFWTNDLRSLDLQARGFEFCPEVTAKLRRAGVSIVEVPVAYHARHLKGGKKLRWWDGLSVVATLLEWRLRRVPPLGQP